MTGSVRRWTGASARGWWLGAITAGILLSVAAPMSAARTDAGTAQPGLRPSQRRAELLPLYRALRADPAARARSRGLRLEDRARVDAFLRDLPISPLDYLQIDMWARRYEFAIPRFIQEVHRRWMTLHQEPGRRLYGDAAVDSALRAFPLEPVAEETAEPSAAMAAAADVPTGAGSVAQAPAGEAVTAALVIGKNRNVAGDFGTEPEDYQGEIQLAVDPADPSRMVAAANTWDDIGGTCGDFGLQAVFYSADGGTTWGYSCPPDAAAYGLDDCTADLGGLGTFGSDPSLAWGADGSVYLAYMALCAVDLFDVSSAIVVARSTDGGATWGARGVVTDSLNTTSVLEDKEILAIDNHPGSPFFGRQYACWDRSNDQRSAWSADGGATWNGVDLDAPNKGETFDLGCDIAIADDGTVHVVFNSLTCATQFCQNEQAFHTKSTDGGESWSSLVEVHDFHLSSFSEVSCPDAQDDRCLSATPTIDIDNSGGECRGRIYVAYTDSYAGNDPTAEKSNIYLRSSSDGGASWGSQVKVNSDSESTFTAQFHPWLAFDNGNRHAVIAWHDTRDDSSDDEVRFYVGRSADCGATWTDEATTFPSDEFKNASRDATKMFTAENVNANPNQYGEYLGLDVHGGRAFVAWTDTRQYYPSFTSESQKENVGFAEVRFAEIFLDGFETGDTSIWRTTVDE